MSIDESSVALVADRRDNLQEITGIGAKFAEALYQAGIARFADLARYSPQQISALLKEQGGATAAPERIKAEDWIGQAGRLAGSVDSELGATAVKTESPPVEAAVDNQKPARHQHAGFSLFFDYIIHESGEREWQTKVYHEEASKEAIFAGTDTAVWVNWIMKQAKLPPVSASGTSVEEVEEDEVKSTQAVAHQYDVKLQLLGVQAIPGPSAGLEDNKWVAEVRFALRGPDAAFIAGQRIPYQVEFQMLDLTTNKIAYFVELSEFQLEPGKFEYLDRHEMPMPDAGRYELQTNVYVHPPAEMRACYAGPALNIKQGDVT
ncbi:MAG: DUF4332 domain-containing protein [Chloroflexi bacterium]|nr:DUF4332 domain-containing protein [Chloroflexota bacterium]